MRPELYEAVREATHEEFDVVAELAEGAGWAMFLGKALYGGGTVVLLVQEAEGADDQFDLDVMSELEPGLPVGCTTCRACGAAEEGWPRFCGTCQADQSGIPADAAVPGESAPELLSEVRAAAEGVYEVLGAVPHAEGGGMLYFAREVAAGRVVGLALHEGGGGELDLVVSWTPGVEAQPAYKAGVDSAREPTSAAPEPTLAGAPAATPVPEPAVPGLWESPPSTRRGSPGRTRRLIGVAAVGGIGLALVTALLLVVFRDPAAAPGTVISTHGPGIAPAGPGPVDTAVAATTGAAALLAPSGQPQPAPPGYAAPDHTGGNEERQPMTEAASPASVAKNTTPEAPPAGLQPDPAAGPSAATPTTAGAEAAVRRYVSAVQTRQVARIQDAYPGITPRETERWTNFFRNVGPGEFRVSYAAEAPVSLAGSRGELVFTLTLSYTAPAGSPVQTPLPLRAILQWRQGQWSLEEVRSLN